ncbi:NAD-binding protein [Mycena rebaudengoi]|nr:NAD-binding protein [Mycena rebaudengoi]
MTSKGVALVTGAAQGIGRAIALKLADDGFDVAVNDMPAHEEKLDHLVDEIKAKGRTSSKHIANVSLDEQVRKMVEQVVQQLGGLDVLVANAGILGRPNLAIVDASVEEWERLMSVNARGTFLCYKYAGAQMIKQGRGGRIIGCSSLAGKQGMGLQAAYSASKFAVRGLTQAAAIEFGPHKITVNAYAPGGIAGTAIMDSADPDWRVNQNFPKQQGPQVPPGTPEDLTGLVSFLASKESQFVTGQTISANGGAHFD